MNRLLIKDVMDLAVHLTDEGWEKLTVRTSLFYGFMAALNVYIAAHYSFPVWLSIKLWAFIPLNFLFFVAQVPLFMRYEIKDPEQPTSA